ncbi:hypothetical protein O6P43_023713 [Quillaja saponaria]|uniref:Uncharacterized protein n=1 Tax=Quillaja saponaria TaxID=32244 RepID=A0AAD7PJU8_QUISA|nr:hypothetical protein O6P43_023713 [Quillaja saponaria]
MGLMPDQEVVKVHAAQKKCLEEVRAKAVVLKDKPMSVSKDKSICKDNYQPKKATKFGAAITSWAQSLEIFDISPSSPECTTMKRVVPLTTVVAIDKGGVPFSQEAGWAGKRPHLKQDIRPPS